ncbi:hypothetical protein FKM82_001159 [Ascaphus truei]
MPYSFQLPPSPAIVAIVILNKAIFCQLTPSCRGYRTLLIGQFEYFRILVKQDIWGLISAGSNCIRSDFWSVLKQSSHTFSLQLYTLYLS